jgi:hypothetical protein
MALNFPNVSVLGLTQQARFFDAGFLYATFKRLSIAGTINDLAETYGITGVWSGAEGVLATIRNNRNYEALILNGVNFGSGRIESIDFDPGLDVKLKGYTANITVYDSGNLFNFTGQYYSGIETTNFPNLAQFDESYSFNKPLNGGYSYSHNASIQFISGSQNLFAIGAAQSLARTLFTGGNLGFVFYPGFTDKQGKRYVTETYNLIDNSCGFQETFAFDNDNGAYSATYTTAIQLDDQGVVTATENGNIRGIENPNYQKALSAVAVEMTGSYYRCSGAVQTYFPTGAILIDAPISQGRAIDIFNNVVDYTVVFNNSPVNQRSYYWDHTLSVAYQDGVSTVTEQGAVQGRGENETVAFNNARTGFGIVQAGISGRCGALFVGPYAPATNYLVSKSQSFAPVQSRVTYGYSYSNDPTLIANEGVRRVEVSVDKNPPIYIYNKLGIVQVAEIAQNDYQGTQGAYNIGVALEGDKTVGLSDFLSTAVGYLNSNAPAGNDRYVGAAAYTYDINQNAANVNLTWLYNRSVSETRYPQ